MATVFEAALASAALAEHARYGGLDEDTDAMGARIRAYYAGLGFPFASVSVPWSAVFVSWCVKQAGATRDEFLFSPQHSQFVHRAITDAATRRGVFRGVRFDEAQPTVGDLIQWNQPGNAYDFAHAEAHESYPSHSAIVVATGEDASGRFAMTVGGNEADTVGRSRIGLTAAGLVRQRARQAFISLVQTLK